MPFDPNQPQNGELIDAVQLRDQFNGLKALIDALPATSYGRVAADWTSGSASFGDVTGLAFPVAAGESWTAELVLGVVSGTSGQGLKFRVAGAHRGVQCLERGGTLAWPDQPGESLCEECPARTIVETRELPVKKGKS